MRLFEILDPNRKVRLRDVVNDDNIDYNITVRRAKSNIWWIAYAKSLHNQGVIPAEDIKPFIMKLRAMDKELTNREVMKIYNNITHPNKQ